MGKNYKDVFNYKYFKNLRFAGEFELPYLNPTDEIPDKIISFNYVSSMLKKKDFNPKEYFVHFFIDDYQFERIWTSPDRYLNQLSQFAGIIMPDFSVYINFPIVLQAHSIFKSRVLAAYYSSRGITVIPNITWSDKESLEWVLDGLPKNSVVALSSNGVLNANTVNDFVELFNEVMERLEPKKIVFVGSIPTQLMDDKRIIQFNSHLQNMQKGV